MKLPAQVPLSNVQHIYSHEFLQIRRGKHEVEPTAEFYYDRFKEKILNVFVNRHRRPSIYAGYILLNPTYILDGQNSNKTIFILVFIK